MEFYRNQKEGAQPVDFCTSSVDRIWEMTRKRNVERANRKRNENADFSTLSMEDFEGGDSESDSQHEEYTQPTKKTKYEFTKEQLDQPGDKMPAEYRHVRRGQRSVRPEIYTVISKLQSELHMSNRQAEGAIVTISNELFGRNWKVYDKNKPSDCNTLPSMSNTRRVEPYIEAMALSRIVDELMNSEEACVVYSNDGSSLSGVGKFIVQSLTINGTPRSLSTLGIFSESRESLSELVKCSLEMLAASTSYRFTAADIQRKIQFVMTDSTAHNLRIMEQVAKDLNVEETPSAVICNIHPLMMFQTKIKELCQQIHDSFGKNKLNDCFLVDVEYRNESFIIKAIKCLSNLINSDNSSKPWNRHSHFSEFIAPKKNMSLCLKDHRFNRIQDCSLSLLYHFDDIVKYLDKYKNIVNGLTVLDRSFAEMEILKPILATISLLGVHITRPFQTLIMDPSTNYSMLIKTFEELYLNLNNTPSEELLEAKYTCNFIKEDIFTTSLPATCLVENLNVVAAKYHNQVCSLLELALPSFADGLAKQRGAIFGFGPTANHETGSLLKVASADRWTVLCQYITFLKREMLAALAMNSIYVVSRTSKMLHESTFSTKAKTYFMEIWDSINSRKKQHQSKISSLSGQRK